MSHQSADPDRQRSDDPPPVAPRHSAFETVTQTLAGLSGLALMVLVATPLAFCLLLLALLIFAR